jgi:hypothetical protein
LRDEGLQESPERRERGWEEKGAVGDDGLAPWMAHVAVCVLLHERVSEWLLGLQICGGMWTIHLQVMHSKL